MGRIVCASLLSLAVLAGCAQAGGTSGPPASQPSLPSSVDATIAPSPDATASTEPTPDATPGDTPEPVVAWPAVGPAPSSAAPATTFLTLLAWGDTGGYAQPVAVLEDGRVVVMRMSEPGQPLEVRQLRPAGLETIRTAVASVGLFDMSRQRKLVKPLDCCGAGVEIAVTVDGRTVRASEMGAPAGYYAASSAWDRFDALAASLRDIDGWLNASAWATPAWQPYHAPAFCLQIWQEPGLTNATVAAEGIDWPTGVRPFALFGEPMWADSTTRIGPVSPQMAYAIVRSMGEQANLSGLSARGWYDSRLEDGGRMSFYGIGDTAANVTITLYLDPIPPDFGRCGG